MDGTAPAGEATPRRPAPSPSASPVRQDKEAFWGRGKDSSLESFAITTTPFHENDEDGEYYMDETGNMMHRWVVKTEVKGVKPAKTSTTGKTAVEKQRSSEETKDAAKRTEMEHANPIRDPQMEGDADVKADSGWGSAASTMGSSGSSAEEAAVQRQAVSSQPIRPRLNRHSRSSFRPSERANHASPERSDIAGKYQTEMVTTPEEERRSMKYVEVKDGSDSDSHPLQLAKALSCPSSPTQQPLVAPGQHSSPPSPKLMRAQTLDIQQLPTLDNASSSSNKAYTRPQARSRRSSYHTSNRGPSTTGSSRTWSRMRISTEDPYLAHQRAVLLFSPPPPPPSVPKPVERTDSGQSASSSSTVPANSNATKTISAAAFLASRSDEDTPVVSPRAAEGSKRNSTLSATASDIATQKIAAHSTETEDGSGAATPTATVTPVLPVLTNHRIALDWTHPETRAREERRRNGLVGRMKRMLSRSRSRNRADEWQDDGSVRRMRIGSFGSNEPEEEDVKAGREKLHEQTMQGSGRDKGTKRGWNCFG